MPIIHISFKINTKKEPELVEKFDKLWQDLKYPSRSFYLKKLMRSVVDYND